MKGPWESKTAEMWKRKPGPENATVVRFNPIAGRNDAGYPSGDDYDIREAKFLKMHENDASRQYIHTVELRLRLSEP